MQFTIRKAKDNDVNELWTLMKELAIFENYLDSFSITPKDILQNGFRKNPPDFYCLVAEDIKYNRIAGMLVYFFLPYTAKNKPAIFMKELYVHENYRRKGIGEALMKALAKEALSHECYAVKWNVAPWNKEGIRFYERLGAQENRDWLHFEWNEDEIHKLIE